MFFTFPWRFQWVAKIKNLVQPLILQMKNQETALCYWDLFQNLRGVSTFIKPSAHCIWHSKAIWLSWSCSLREQSCQFPSTASLHLKQISSLIKWASRQDLEVSCYKFKSEYSGTLSKYIPWQSSCFRRLSIIWPMESTHLENSIRWTI